VTNADAPPFQATEGRTLPSGTATTTVGGIAIAFGGFAILAIAEVDADADADVDALVALESPTETAVGLGRREDSRFVQSILARSPRREGCATVSSNVRVVATDAAVFTSHLRCANGPRVVFEVATLGVVSRAAFAVELEAPPADDPFLASLTVMPRADDVNSDGLTDIVFDVETRDRFGGSPRTENFAVHQSVTGYSATLASVATRATAIARSATRDLRRQAPRAARDAAHGLAFVRAMCPEAGAARVTLRGIAATCGEPGSPSRFASPLAVALAKTSRLDDLVRLLDTLETNSISIDDPTRGSIGEALRTIRSRIVPSYAAVSLPPEVPATMTFGFDEGGALVTTGAITGRIQSTPPFTFSPDPTAQAATAARVRRFGDQLLAVRNAHAVAIAMPSLEGGTIRDCVLDAAVRRVVCRSDGGPLVAALGGPP